MTSPSSRKNGVPKSVLAALRRRRLLPPMWYVGPRGDALTIHPRRKRKAAR